MRRSGIHASSVFAIFLAFLALSPALALDPATPNESPAERAFRTNEFYPGVLKLKYPDLAAQECAAGQEVGCILVAYSKAWSAYFHKTPNDGASTLVGYCNRGSAKGCHYAGKFFVDSGDNENGRKAYGIACSKGLFVSCGSAGLYNSDQDPARGRAYYETGCNNADAFSCSGLGRMHEYGRGGPKDLNAAAQAYQRGCALGRGGACWEAAELYLGANHQPTAMQFLAEGCRLRESRACDKHKELQTLAGGGPAAARITNKKACDQGDGASCFALAGLYQRGEGGPVDLKEASYLFARACDGSIADGCLTRGDMLAQEMTKDMHPYYPRRAYERACNLGDDRGCVKMRQFEARYPKSKTAPDVRR